MAYDPATRLLLLFGGSSDAGQSSGVLSDTWAWNGADWTQLTAVRLPSWNAGSADRLRSGRAPGHRAGAAPRLPMLATRAGELSRQHRPWPGWQMAVGRALLVLPRRAPGAGNPRGVFAGDPPSGGMLYYRYSPPAPS